MHSVSIRELKNNPSNMTKYLKEGESVFVTKHNKPIGITIPLNDDVLSIGIKKAVAIEQYKMGLISIGKMAQLLSISKTKAIRLLNDLNIDWLDYDTDELKEQLDIARKHAR